jgi:hypothetical protein
MAFLSLQVYIQRYCQVSIAVLTVMIDTSQRSPNHINRSGSCLSSNAFECLMACVTMTNSNMVAHFNMHFSGNIIQCPSQCPPAVPVPEEDGEGAPGGGLAEAQAGHTTGGSVRGGRQVTACM